MITVVLATTNQGKQEEAMRVVAGYSGKIKLEFLDKQLSPIVEESGSTFEDNALLKARAFQKVINDDSIVIVGDDSGIKIPALNNEPGVFTHRWAGYEMSDDDVLSYCLKRMHKLKGDDRKAVFETVLVAVKGLNTPVYYKGEMWGRIAEKPSEVEPVIGFPFRSVFWVDEVSMPIYQLHEYTEQIPDTFLTHRGKALKQLFDDLAKN